MRENQYHRRNSSSPNHGCGIGASRGEIIDESVMAQMIEDGQIAGAVGVDTARGDTMTLEELPFNDQLPTLDPPVHTDHRALLMKLITPKRLKENEEAMEAMVDKALDDYLVGSGGELIAEFAGLARQFEADVGNVVVGVFDEYPDGLLV